MTQNPETLKEVLSNLLALALDGWWLLVAILIIVFSGMVIAAIIDHRTEKRISRLRAALLKNPNYEKLIEEITRNLKDLRCIVVDEIDSGWDTKTVSKRDTRALRRLLNLHAQHPLGGLLTLIGIK